ncbi:nonribosomal peptide synthetase DhbF [Lentzea xinjiangensis]|uniref:Nonribosomal peptide synthetase DhbF n=1 Tax=Lentzea xinjiangensis TaxID=402600 RepID=A0A1H9SYB9_9PSEU|nr:non-ribosomal peptide synthetase [Lentzea xinjiangensis]SER89868.1 nonribosomal peptide synthetase DhbF [Lentzea xinjiangensis]
MPNSTAGHPLTPAQLGVWFAQQMDPASPIYNIGEYLEITGSVDVALFEAAIRIAVDETEALHVGFADTDDGPRQIVRPPGDWTVDVIDLRGEPDPRAAAVRVMRADLGRPVDLIEDRLFAQMVFVAADRVFWYQRAHHVVLDAYGLMLVARRVSNVYTALAAGEPPTAEFSRLPDLLADEQAFRESGQWERDRRFWMERLTGDARPVNLAGRWAATSRSFLRHSTTIAPDQAEVLAAAARRAKVNWSRVAISAVAAYVHRITGSAEVRLGLPVPARLGPVTRRVPGMVANVAPLRCAVASSTKLGELVGEVSREVLQVLRHQRYRAEDLRRDLGLLGEDRRLYGPVVNIMQFDYTFTFGGLPCVAHNLATGPIEDLSINIYERGSGAGLQVNFDGNPALYRAEDLVTHGRRFTTLLTAFAENPDQCVGDVDLLTDDERRQAARWNATGRVVPELDGDIAGRFAAQVARNPDAVAVDAAGTRLTYRDLDRRADLLARRLAALGVGAETPVALLVERSAELVVALIAITKAGGVQAPLHSGWPDQRLALVAADVGAAVLLVDRANEHRTFDHDMRVVPVEEEHGSGPVETVHVPAEPAQLAYVMYTSGSTGTPKGVGVTHRDVLALALDQRWSPDDHERVLHYAPHAFDAATYELWVPLLNGHTVVLAPAGNLDAPELRRLVADKGVTGLWLTAGLFAELADSDPSCFSGVRHLITGGDVVSPAAVRAVLGACPGLAIANGYGPTETTTFALYHRMTAQSSVGTTVPVGLPLDNMRAHVLDARLRPVPPGVVGELYVSGDGVARGYLNQPGRTAERFVADPFGTGDRMYRTGDLVRRRDDGVIEFVGRHDDQVKIRGFRVELGDIENALAGHDSVAQAVVVVREHQPGDRRLVAYVTLAGDGAGTVDVEALREHLAATLPGHMVPAAVVVLPRFPLTLNGKIDRASLPAPDFAAGAAGKAPVTPRERGLAALFAEVLGLPSVGVDDDFFKLGGHSLLATRLISRIRAEEGVDLGIKSLFDTPTVAGLAASLDAAGAVADDDRPPLVARRRPDLLPVSFAQQRLWFLHRLEGPSATYNIPLALRLSGTLNRAALELALRDVVLRHESLRTVFPEHGGTPVQSVLSAADVVVTLSASESTEEALPDDLVATARRPFDISAELPVRGHLFVLGEQEHVFLLLLHHIAGDGWSMAPLARDLALAYGARCAGGVPGWGVLPVQYADYALWQRELLGEESDPGSRVSRQLEFWRSVLAGLPEQIDLPTDRSHPAVAGFRGDSLAYRIEPELHQRLLKVARGCGASVFMVLQAGLAALLSRLGAGVDVPIGSPIAGRTDAALDDLVGFFVNTLVLRTDVSGDPSFAELVERVRAADLAAYANQDVPFERLVEVLNPTRSLSRNPLFQVMLGFQSVTEELPGLGGLTTAVEPVDACVAKFDLSFSLLEHRGMDSTPDGIDGVVEYRTDLFEELTVRTLVQRWTALLDQAAGDSRRRVSRFEILVGDEERRLLSEWNGSARARLHAGSTVQQRFARQAAATPDAIAVSAGGERMTYRELDAAANRLARVLIGLGVRAESPVAIVADRSIGLVVGTLAILKAGGVYVPLHLGQPDERLNLVLADVRPVVVLADRTTRARVADQTAPVLLLDDHEAVSAAGADDPAVPVAEEQLAYVMYTSGSSGTPKGVAITHRDVLDLALDSCWQPEKHARVLLHAPHAFDISTYELWVPLLTGGQVVVAPAGDVDARFLERVIADEDLTAVHLTAGLFRVMAEEQPSMFKGLREVLTGGDVVSSAAVRRVLDHCPGVVIRHLYGPTEITLCATQHPVARGHRESDVLPIGVPLDNTRVYVLDATLRPVPAGTPGELYIGGAGLARGYHGRPGMTAERFVADPFGLPGERLYRTGDVVRWNAAGELVFLGRSDEQVKIRGFRVETAEAEAVLAGQHDVAQGVVVAWSRNPGDTRLAGFVVPAARAEVRPAELRNRLGSVLPDYLVPETVTVLDRIPLTVNGKLDREKLVELAAEEVDGQAPDGTPPRTAREKALCEIFAEVLAVPSVGVDDNFFTLGGHSLLVIQACARMKRVLGVDVAPRSLFIAPTVASLDAMLSDGQHDDGLGRMLPLRPGGELSPLFCVHPGGGVGWSYTGLLTHLEPGRPVHVLQAAGLRADGPLPGSIEEMAAEYAELIRGVRPHGPYHLLGWSFGGLVAHAVAKLLRDQGEEVGLLAVLDAYPGDPRYAAEPSEQDVLEAVRHAAGVAALPDEERTSAFLAVAANNVRLARSHVAGHFDGDLLLVTAEADRTDQTPAAGSWRDHVGHIAHHPLAHRHADLTGPQALAEIGPLVAEHLRRTIP